MLTVVETPTFSASGRTTGATKSWGS